VAVIDPRNPATSEANASTWSLVYLPGSEFSDTTNVPHGAVAQVTLKKHKFNVVSKASDGGHTWINWRDYLHEFAPLLFSEK